MDATQLVSEFTGLLLQLSSAFTQPTFKTFEQLAVGWILCPHPGTVTGMIRTLGSAATKHWTVFEKFFYRASWSLESLTPLLLRLMAPLLGERIDLNIDDTTCGPRGKHVAYAGWFMDHSAHGERKVFHWSHNWVIGAVALRLKRWSRMRLNLPVAFALHRKKAACDGQHPYRTLGQLALAMVRQAADALSNHRLFVAVDGYYATRVFFGQLPANVQAVSRLRKDAALWELPPTRAKTRTGRPPRRGRRLPPVEQRVKHIRSWQTVVLTRQGRTVRRLVHGFTCLWCHVCSNRPVRVVIVRDPAGREDDLHLVCNDPTVSDRDIAQRFLDRWGVEECIQEAKQQMGMERTRGFCPKTVTRQAPMAMVLTTLVKLWYVQFGADQDDLKTPTPPWYSHKQAVSFRDMLAALRLALWRQRVSINSHRAREFDKTLQALTYALCLAA
jgi:hypothetical protein